MSVETKAYQPFELFGALELALQESDPIKKCEQTKQIYTCIASAELSSPSNIQPCRTPGYPSELVLVAPRQLKRRGLQSQTGRNIFMHAIAHIEFNAINLALDAAYRFRDMPTEFTQDWLSVAADEARHFLLLRSYLNNHDCDYGDYPAHNGLWEMAESTANDVIARMALVPRVLEARGLDVTPKMIERLEAVNDLDASERLKVIYTDEIGHVLIGSKWFNYACGARSLDPQSTFFAAIDQHLHGEIKGPFNIKARLQAGFSQIEMQRLESACNHTTPKHSTK